MVQNPFESWWRKPSQETIPRETNYDPLYIVAPIGFDMFRSSFWTGKPHPIHTPFHVLSPPVKRWSQTSRRGWPSKESDESGGKIRLVIDVKRSRCARTLVFRTQAGFGRSNLAGLIDVLIYKIVVYQGGKTMFFCSYLRFCIVSHSGHSASKAHITQPMAVWKPETATNGEALAVHDIPAWDDPVQALYHSWVYPSVEKLDLPMGSSSPMISQGYLTCHSNSQSWLRSSKDSNRRIRWKTLGRPSIFQWKQPMFYPFSITPEAMNVKIGNYLANPQAILAQKKHPRMWLDGKTFIG